MHIIRCVYVCTHRMSACMDAGIDEWVYACVSFKHLAKALSAPVLTMLQSLADMSVMEVKLYRFPSGISVFSARIKWLDD